MIARAVNTVILLVVTGWFAAVASVGVDRIRRYARGDVRTALRYFDRRPRSEESRFAFALLCLMTAVSACCSMLVMFAAVRVLRR